jgi:hypothetical protein
LRLATTFDPMNPAPPVTNNIDRPVAVEVGLEPTSRSFAPVRRDEQHCVAISCNLRSTAVA